MVIDTSLIEPMAFNKGSMYNFIGEIYCHEKLILRARIANCIDGMDMELFNEALDVRRKYLQENIFEEDQMLWAKKALEFLLLVQQFAVSSLELEDILKIL